MQGRRDFFFLPYIIENRVIDVVEQCGLPGSSDINNQQDGSGGFNRYAQYTVDDSIDYLGVEGAHRVLPDGDAGSMWLTEFRLDDCANDYVVYNLNGTYNLTSNPFNKSHLFNGKKITDYMKI